MIVTPPKSNTLMSFFGDEIQEQHQFVLRKAMPRGCIIFDNNIYFYNKSLLRISFLFSSQRFCKEVVHTTARGFFGMLLWKGIIMFLFKSVISQFNNVLGKFCNPLLPIILQMHTRRNAASLVGAEWVFFVLKHCVFFLVYPPF